MRATTNDANKALYFRFATLLGENNLDALEELLTPGFVDHSLPEGLKPGAASLKDVCSTLLGRFPDIHLVLEDLIAEGDRVAARIAVHGSSSSGHTVTTELIDIVRIDGERIVERWSHHSGCHELDHVDAAQASTDAGESSDRVQRQGGHLSQTVLS